MKIFSHFWPQGGRSLTRFIHHYPRKYWRGFWLVLLTLALTLGLRSPAVAAIPDHYTHIQFPPLPDVTLPDYERYELANGLVVYLLENHQLPLVGGSAYIRTGSRLEPGEKAGLADLTGTVMRTGGTTHYTGNELNEILEQIAASIETSMDQDSGSASFSSLSEDFEMVLSLFTDVLQNPAFSEDKLELAKKQRQGAIARRNDEPDDIASREFYKLIYGDGSPYGRTVEYATLDRITQGDLQQFHRQYVRPENMILGIAGDFDSAQVKPLIQKLLGSWQPAPVEEPLGLDAHTIPQAQQKLTGGTFFVDQPQLNQSSILIGHLGGMRNDEDYPTLSVVNGLLNGLGGRLFNELRSRQGLAYSVYGYWSANYDYPGVFIGGGQTRSVATVPFIQSFFQEMERLRTETITPEELNYAKDSILNSFVFNFQKPSQTISRLMHYEYFGYPQDFIFQYQNRVKATTSEDIQRVANGQLHPEEMIVLVVGNGNEIQPNLSTLQREITGIDITIPES